MRKLRRRKMKSCTHLRKDSSDEKNEVRALPSSKIPRNKYCGEREPIVTGNTQRRSGTHSATTTKATTRQRGNLGSGTFDQNSTCRRSQAVKLCPIRFCKANLDMTFPLPPPIPVSRGVYLLGAFHCRFRPRSTIL